LRQNRPFEPNRFSIPFEIPNLIASEAISFQLAGTTYQAFKSCTRRFLGSYEEGQIDASETRIRLFRDR
jgi:hypothetical protein